VKAIRAIEFQRHEGPRPENPRNLSDHLPAIAMINDASDANCQVDRRVSQRQVLNISENAESVYQAGVHQIKVNVVVTRDAESLAPRSEIGNNCGNRRKVNNHSSKQAGNSPLR